MSKIPRKGDVLSSRKTTLGEKTTHLCSVKQQGGIEKSIIGVE